MARRPLDSIDTLIVHHTGSGFGDLELIARWHAERRRPIVPVGYHFGLLNGFRRAGEYIAAADGLLEIGRPMDQVGAHDLGQNRTSLGVVLVGYDFITWSQLVGLHGLTQGLRASLRRHLKVEGHGENEPNDTPTRCPGERLGPHLDLLRKWLDEPFPATDSTWRPFLSAVLGQNGLSA